MLNETAHWCPFFLRKEPKFHHRVLTRCSMFRFGAGLIWRSDMLVTVGIVIALVFVVLAATKQEILR